MTQCIFLHLLLCDAHQQKESVTCYVILILPKKERILRNSNPEDFTVSRRLPECKHLGRKNMYMSCVRHTGRTKSSMKALSINMEEDRIKKSKNRKRQNLGIEEKNQELDFRSCSGVTVYEFLDYYV